MSPEDAPPLGSDALHLWSATLDLGGRRWFDPGQLLAPDEQARAGRFGLERDRVRYANGRSLLRLLLGHYRGADPAALRFNYENAGKPVLLDAGGLSFNLAHSQGMILIGVTRERRLGVDLEGVRFDLDVHAMAERFFAPAEVEALQAEPWERRREAFFAVWTRKEAYLKARGTGLTESLASFVVSCQPDNPPPVRVLQPCPGEPTWHLHSLTLPGRFLAAACADRALPAVRLFPWREALREGTVE